MRDDPPPPTSAASTPEPPSLSGVVERLFAAFESRLTLPAIFAVVQRCRAELDTVPGPALPELVERLARQRLHDLVTTRSTGIGAGNSTPSAND